MSIGGPHEVLPSHGVPTVWERTQRALCSSPPDTIPGVCGAKQPSPIYAASPRSTLLRGSPAANGSTAVAIAVPTTRCGASSWCAWPPTRAPVPTSPAAPPRAAPSARSSARSNATSPASSTAACLASRPFDIDRSITARPPEASMMRPVTQDDSSDISQSTTFAISRGVPERPEGTVSSMPARVLEARQRLYRGLQTRRGGE